MKILQITDLHFDSYPFNELDQKTADLIVELVEKQQPELLVVSGDLVSGYNTVEGLTVFQGVINFLDDLGVKLAITYGNHDSEGRRMNRAIEDIQNEFETEEEVSNYITKEQPELYLTYSNRDKIDSYTREDMNEIVAQMDNHVKKQGLAESNGKEMYYIDLNEEVRILIVDSGDYDQNGLSFYDSIDFRQQDWIIEHSRDPAKVSHLFIHIPLPEYTRAKRAGLAEGNQGEDECSADYNTGTWSRLKLQTNVKAVYCGHDHDNDYSVNYHGVQLNYGRVTGYNSYGKLERGGRIIEINGKEHESYIVTQSYG